MTGSGNGREEVQAEITSLLVTDSESSFGTIVLSLNQNIHPSIDQRALGTIEETVNTTPGTLDLPPYAASGTATVRFDTFLQAEISGGFLNDTGHNDVALVLQGTFTSSPPAAGDKLVMQNGEDVQVLTAADTSFNGVVIESDDLAEIDLNATSCED